MSQLTRIKEYLIRNGSITTKDAIKECGFITRLSAHIFTLKEQGLKIVPVRESNSETWWVRYVLVEVPKEGWDK